MATASLTFSANRTVGSGQQSRTVSIQRGASLAPLRLAAPLLRRRVAASASASASRSATYATAVEVGTFPRVVPDVLPRVYVYDHCPFCVRVRLALGYKNVKHAVRFLANDDVETPTKLIGKKVAPILELPDAGLLMMESLDIIERLDSDPKYGPTNVIAPMSGRKDIKAWMKSVQSLLRLLHRPRYMLAGLPEFQQKDSRDYFVAGHQLPPYEKADWKTGLDMDTKWSKYREAYMKTPEMLPELNAKLRELEDLIYCPDYCTEGIGFSYDDIDLWSRLRSLTIVRGAEFGPKTKAYLTNLSEMCDVTLYNRIAM